LKRIFGDDIGLKKDSRLPHLHHTMAAIAAVALGLAITETTRAEAPDLQSGTPVIYLADNLDEPEKLGWCIDTQGRGFGEMLHAHSCKPAGQGDRDTQFSYNAESGQIRSVAFPEYCMTFSSPDDMASPFGLMKCMADDAQQTFAYDEASMEIRIGGDASTCVLVAPDSFKAGPFHSRGLLHADCGSVEDKFKQWIVKQ